jgi:hypothetical protein
VKSAADAAVLEAPVSQYGAVIFCSGENRSSVLKNFVIRRSDIGVLIQHSSPTLSQLTIVYNKFGIDVYKDSYPLITGNILWYNEFDDLWIEQANVEPADLKYEVRYNWIERKYTGMINENYDPLFADPDNGDYHLRSTLGRFVSDNEQTNLTGGYWVCDNVNSPCIDAGDPEVRPGLEPLPNGGRINIGAYGNSSTGSKSRCVLNGDINCDGMVNVRDFTGIIHNWLRAGAN